MRTEKKTSPLIFPPQCLPTPRLASFWTRVLSLLVVSAFATGNDQQVNIYQMMSSFIMDNDCQSSLFQAMRDFR